jgi:diacylglycerol kinase family enzyme
LDILFLGDISKLTMLGYALGKRAAFELDDPRVRQFRAHSIEINTDPPMQVMADGQMLGVCPAQIVIRRHALGVMTAGPVRNEEKEHHVLAAVQ